jgi:uncharacterized phage protein (TIGR02220 family)
MIVEPDFFDHWKTRMLVDLLDGDELAPVYVMRLWGHCQQRRAFAFSMPTAALRSTCRYKGDPAKFEQAMTDAGFVSRNEDSDLVANGWDEYNAKLIANWTNGQKGGRPPKKGRDEDDDGEPKPNPPKPQTKPQTKPKSNPLKTQPEPSDNPTETQTEFGVTDKIGLEKSSKDKVKVKTIVGQEPDGSDSQPDESASADSSEQAEGEPAGAELPQRDPERCILAYLNEKTGSNYKPVESNLKFIRGRLAEGATAEEVRAVIDAKVKEWAGKPQATYLRPETLFNATKFASYVGQLGARVSTQSAPPKSRHDLSGMDYSRRRTDGLPF